MQYDVKLVRFGNGDVEIRLYDEPIYELTEAEKERRLEKRLRTMLNRKEEDESDFDDVSMRFEFCDEPMVSTGLSEDGFELLKSREEMLADLQKMRFHKNARDSRRRTVNAIHDIARSERWTMFYTLTFSPVVVNRTCFEACMKKANKWFNNLRRKAPNLKYLFVPELHADKVSWHIHGLVCCDDGVNYVDSGKCDKKGRVIYNVGDWRYGFSTATKIEDTSKASSYILKYITKELCEASFQRKRYYHSKNIEKPIVETFSAENDFGIAYENLRKIEFLDVFLDSLGADVSRVKKVKSEYCSVTYINAHIEESEENETWKKEE